MKKIIMSITVVAVSFLMRSSANLNYITDDNYEMTKYQVTEFISYYQQIFTEEILDHKDMEKEIKKELVYAYNCLKEEDRKPFAEFIHHILTGGIPKVVNKKKNNIFIFNNKDTIDLYFLIVVTDPEDGIITLNENNTKINTNLNTKVSGKYKVEYIIKDSDDNIIEYIIYIIIDNKEEIQENIPKEKVVIDNKENKKVTVPPTGL